jgi:hypothetical protein
VTQLPRATIDSHAVATRVGTMTHAPAGMLVHPIPSLSPQDYDRGVTTLSHQSSGTHQGQWQQAPPPPAYSNQQDYFGANSPYPGTNHPTQPDMTLSAEGGQAHYYPEQVRMPPTAVPHTNDEGYRFGDITRSIVAKGKKSSGRSEKDGYKFGDFTRGLFKK